MAKRSYKKYAALGVLLLTLILSVAALGGWFAWRQLVSTPYQGYLTRSKVIEISRGEPAVRIAQRLESEGVVQSALIFRLFSRWEGESLKAGRYRFDGPVSLDSVHEKLVSGEVEPRRVTIREGLDTAETAAVLARAGLGEVRPLILAMHDPRAIQDLDPSARSLEGYLFPDTYEFSSDVGEVEVIHRLVENFRRQWTAARSSRAQALGWTLREVVTLASLIEKETAVAAERDQVSAVFHNRLQMGMRLMCDPTVIYAVKLRKEYDGIIHRSDLRLDSPYNTYLYPGLPPGPIASPGLDSIDAALEPAQSDYLYFVSRNDGTHQFSESYRKHRQAVQRYQR